MTTRYCMECDENGDMVPDADGDYVLYSDYAALLAEVERLQAENAKLLKEVHFVEGELY